MPNIQKISDTLIISDNFVAERERGAWGNYRRLSLTPQE